MGSSGNIIPDFNWSRSFSERVRGMKDSALSLVWKKGREQKLKEIEAAKICQWLIAAGFPQYVQVYRDRICPIDLVEVERDNEFLNQSSLQVLWRRITVLNHLSRLKVEVPLKLFPEDEYAYALSNHWSYHVTLCRWVHKDGMSKLIEKGRTQSSSSGDSVLIDVEDSPKFLSKKISGNRSQVKSQSNSPCRNQNNGTDANPASRPNAGPFSPGQGSSAGDSDGTPPLSSSWNAGEKYKGKGLKGLFKRSDIPRCRKHSSNGRPPCGRVEIGTPVVVNVPDMKERMEKLQCVEIEAESAGESKDCKNSNIPNRKDTETMKISDNAKTSNSAVNHLKPPLSNISVTNSLSDLRKCDPASNETPDKCRVSDHRRSFDLNLLKNDSDPKQESQISDLSTLNNGISATVVDSSTVDFDSTECSGHRGSIYDNLSSDDLDTEGVFVDPQYQSELDLILEEIYKNINSLDETLDKVDKTCLKTFSKDTEGTKVISNEKVDGINNFEFVDKRTVVDCETDVSANADQVFENNESSSSDQKPRPLSSNERKKIFLLETAGRDSGFGSSLTRTSGLSQMQSINGDCSAGNCHPKFDQAGLHVYSLNVKQLMTFQRFSLLRLTWLMDKYMLSNVDDWLTPWNHDSKSTRKCSISPANNVFGVSIMKNLQLTGLPLPRCILRSMDCLRKTAADAVGVFRKSGVHSRIQQLREQIDSNPGLCDFHSLQVYDVADLLKLYFRELPECLLTRSLSQIFISIFTNIPSDMQMEAVQAAVFLLPDENRDVLKILISFLSDLSQFAPKNQMNASNLAICFAPSLFHIYGQNEDRSLVQASPKRTRSQHSPPLALPETRELKEQKSALDCLTCMITHAKQIFMVSEEVFVQSAQLISDVDPIPNLFDLSPKDVCPSPLRNSMQEMLQDVRENFREWTSLDSFREVDLSYKKTDGPLRLWRCSFEVDALPSQVLTRVLNEAGLWDDSLESWRVVEMLDANTDVVHYSSNAMSLPQSVNFCELRYWRTDLQNNMNLILSTSIDHPEILTGNETRGRTNVSRYLALPVGLNRTRVVFVNQVDIRGHSPRWYRKAYGYVCAHRMVKLKESFNEENRDT